jgi:hypothetical protein
VIVYSDRKRSLDPRAMLAGLRRELAAPAPDPTTLLVEAGVLEAGVVDALSPGEDDEPPLARALRAVMLDLAHAARGAAAEKRLSSAAQRLREVDQGSLPDAVEVSEPEGFAFYALYPEIYAKAARRFARAERPRRATVVGLRSIGTTLSAVVAAELEAQGLPVRSFTVRPRGHPFERELRLGLRLTEALEDGAAGHILVVDEGPGISGSSLACVAEGALRAGAPDGRIALFPSWDPDGTGLRSERARAAWRRHARWVAGFEETFLDTGRLAAPWGGGRLRDLSGGLWRDLLCPSGRLPGVQPQHERRKYLLEREGAPPLLLKFAGLGARGQRALERAEAQAGAGLAPEVEGLAEGFLATRFVEGRPAARLDTGLLGTMERYLAHLAAGPDRGAPRFEDILGMTRLNVAEGLGEAAAGRTGWMDGLHERVMARPTVAGDGRMLPQEWLRTAGGVLKCDGIDHHDDHFWPGTQDIAWDLAGAMVEFGMGAEAREQLLDGFAARTGDRGAREVLPFYEVAYLAWRLGYTTLAAETLGGSEDGLRMARDRDRYAARLRGMLEREAA